MSVDVLAEVTWGEQQPEGVRQTIPTYITRLRRLIGPEAITTEPAGYVLRAAPDDVDALGFVRLLDRASEAAQDESALLSEALGLWHGSAFEGLESDWLAATAGSRLEERRLTAIERRAALYAGLQWGAEAGPTGSDGSRQVVPRQLPADIATFTGRVDALAKLDALITDDRRERPTVVAVYGSGGVGKTSLVVHWAHRIVDQFPDGQLCVSLRGFGPGSPMSPTSALDVLLRGVGIDGGQIPEEVEARDSLLRSVLAEGRTLVILDNAHATPIRCGRCCRAPAGRSRS